MSRASAIQPDAPAIRRKVVVGPIDAFPRGETRRVEVDGRGVAIFNVDGELYALRDVCPHQGGDLSRGSVARWVTAERPGRYAYEPDRKLVACPWHGWEFDLATGESWFDPRRTRVRKYPVEVEKGAGLVDPDVPAGSRLRGPYTVETVTITVEDDYVVLTL